MTTTNKAHHEYKWIYSTDRVMLWRYRSRRTYKCMLKLFNYFQKKRFYKKKMNNKKQVNFNRPFHDDV